MGCYMVSGCLKSRDSRPTQPYTALAHLAVLLVLSAARRLV